MSATKNNRKKINEVQCSGKCHGRSQGRGQFRGNPKCTCNNSSMINLTNNQKV